MKRHNPFPPELRTASVVPRWSIVWTLNENNVAEHSYYVALYAYQIARLIGWSGDYGDLCFAALTDDLDETITGDIVSPVKNEIVDNDRARGYVVTLMNERMPAIMDELHEIEASQPGALQELKRIIKAADRLDALLFLIGEKRMGNGVIEPRIPSARANLEAAWLELPADRDMLQQCWATMIVPAIREHETVGGNGV